MLGSGGGQFTCKPVGIKQRRRGISVPCMWKVEARIWFVVGCRKEHQDYCVQRIRIHLMVGRDVSNCYAQSASRVERKEDRKKGKKERKEDEPPVVEHSHEVHFHTHFISHGACREPFFPIAISIRFLNRLH